MMVWPTSFVDDCCEGICAVTVQQNWGYVSRPLHPSSFFVEPEGKDDCARGLEVAL